MMLGAVALSMAALNPIIDDAARRNGVETALIKAVIQHESNWDVNASRYEPHKKDSSWGLMQVMLVTGKWILKDDKLTISTLIKPQINIEAGTKYLKYQLDRYGGRIQDAIAAYNAGKVRKAKDGTYTNQAYVDKVYRTYLRYKETPDVSVSFNPTLLLAAGLAVGAVAVAMA